MESFLTIITIQLAVLCLFTVWISRAWFRTRRQEKAIDWQKLLWPRVVWSLGAALVVIHTLLAFHFYHAWSHAAAVVDTAGKVEELFGFRFGFGVFLNYFFAAIWCVDAIWWISRPQSYHSRAAWIGGCVTGFLLFITVNATIVFESGFVRWATVALLAIWIGVAVIPPSGKKRNPDQAD